MVTSQQPTNPYAIVLSTHQNSQYSLGGVSGASPQASAASFDPFAPPAPAPVAQPAPAPEPAPVPEPAHMAPQQDMYAASNHQHPHQVPAPQQQDSYANHQAHAPAPAPYAQKDHYEPAPHTNHPLRFDGDLSEPDRQHAPTPPEDTALESNVQSNRYSQELAQVAPPGASPLPKAELVRKKGFVLSRISFRTIVMKKWKQSFWVQYGPHTMLWFRSRADFDDWLNNPYHNQAERNFLIKLAVNFVHDLYKPNVRGYQVTQCRTKGYGKKMVRQFKLERWMDYGPTIAAAFGSYNPKEVDDLREALVECMRNTPLNGGIRATGAVRQQQEQQQQGQGQQGMLYCVILNHVCLLVPSLQNYVTIFLPALFWKSLSLLFLFRQYRTRTRRIRWK
jgi:ribosomal protein S14